MATSFRGVNKATAARFSGPEHTTIRLSRPVPPHAFAAHWLAPGATRGLTLKQRRQLLCLTAASGVVANLEVAERAAGCGPLTYEVFKASASAAGGGHWHVCEWLLSLELTWSSSGEVEAARGGHVGLMEWLQERRPQLRIGQRHVLCQVRLIKEAAHGCDLATLQRLWLGSGQVRSQDKGRILSAAAGSPTPDWAAKVEWLEAQGCPTSSAAMAAATALPDVEAAARLRWLRGRGYPVEWHAWQAAAYEGKMAALQHLLSEVHVDAEDQRRVAVYVAEGGHLAVLQALHLAGQAISPPGSARAAAGGGHLHVLAWLVETFGAEAVRLDLELFHCAARSGSVELLAWLRERGCPWDAEAYNRAASSGCEAALEWLAERGCPMPAEGDPYPAVCANGDLAAARCLLRLGVPWGPMWSVYQQASTLGAPEPMLRWLLEAGCPVHDDERYLEGAVWVNIGEHNAPDAQPDAN
ncbi:hypothetical protein GPECTOR_27g627 [Gonium pectorale]|uniref:Ankyrin repeat domain-containing protein n=1 Tax=Gonium pectorale TaxID=33097 RepID=A0A150GF28_GONPE|nr:hypothetical protein GPECTOR_27g627 [Gonium pectorale]|eukprot:KXZ48457.1 hypothetical protein GPECTOR_27g627 [Gonium pectorale]